MTKTNILVSQLLRRKGSQVYVTRPDATVYEALQVMAEKNIGALLVVDADGLAGIFSERDYARKVIDEQGFVIEQLENYITGGR